VGDRSTGRQEIHIVPPEEVEARMRPGSFSQAGFLGPAESLAQVLDADAHALSELGVSGRVLADRLGQLLEAAVASKQTVTRVGQYEVRLKRYKGVQICPFAPQPHENPCPAGGGVRFASIDWEIRNARTGSRISGPGLIVHLIAAHGFFEGLQSPYRVAPRALAEVLEVGPFASSVP
jgi:hypothetical protein